MTYRQEYIKPYSTNGDKGTQVERMFDSIAHSYDLLNHILSLGIDRHWRKAAIQSLSPFKPRRILDIATGTGDFALLAARMLHPEHITGADLSEKMIEVGRKKIAKAGFEDTIVFQKEDCMHLSFPNESYDAVTVAYGIRNFEDLDKGLNEIFRVTKPNGHLVIIELTAPQKFPMKQLFHFYSHIVMPTLGKFVSRDNSAYTYLPATMEVFPQGETIKGILENAGFKKVSFKRFTAGLSTLYTAEK